MASTIYHLFPVEYVILLSNVERLVNLERQNAG